jgi:hypothetical protein
METKPGYPVYGLPGRSWAGPTVFPALFRYSLVFFRKIL